MATATLKRRALSAAGAVAQHVPIDNLQLFSFVASRSVRAEPWALYQRLHKRGPVRPIPLDTVDSWLVASHAGVTDVLRHHATSVDESLANGMADRRDSDPFSLLMRRTILFTDPPDHARLRRLVSTAFTPRTVEALRPRVDAMVAQRLRELRPRGRADLIADFALPLPVDVICELFGVPASERGRFLHYARHLGPRLDLSIFRDEEVERRGDEAALGVEALLHELIADPRRRDPDGLLSALVAVEESGDRLSTDEVVALCGLLLVAGFETTTNLIGNGVLALLRAPDQLARLRDDLVAPEPAVEELLRHSGPVQLTQRVLLDEVAVCGQPIPKGTLLGLLISAANRDPSVFDEPDRLDLARDPNPHLAFSSGIHHCLGAALARLETAVAVPAILRALPDLRLASKPRWRDTFVLRGLTALEVAWSVG